LPVRAAELFLGNAGTAFRPLTAVLALAGGTYRLAGVPRMHERPIGDLVDWPAAARRRDRLPGGRGLSAAADPAAAARRPLPSSACAAMSRASSSAAC
jgi:hypothetical protein